MANILLQKYKESRNPQFIRNSEQERILQILANDMEQLTVEHQQLIKLPKYLAKTVVVMANLWVKISTFLGLITNRNDDSFLTTPAAKTQGLYLWGSVGTGKTFLCEIFASALQGRVYKLHFSQLMDSLHKQMQLNHKGDLQTLVTYNQARKRAQKRDKQQAIIIANTVNALISDEIQVIYIDELYVEDISDAMLLSQVFNVFSQRKLYLLITSNSPPENLYYGGLKRELFSPAIQWLNKYCRVEKIAIDMDFRSTIENVEDFFCDQPNGKLDDLLLKIIPQYKLPTGSQQVKLMQRQVDCINVGLSIYNVHHSVKWVVFDFDQICTTSRSYRDYVELCKNFQLIIVQNMTTKSDDQLDSIHRFISLIDQIYYSGCAVIIHSDVPLTDFYQGNRLSFSMQRCQSRLFEMRTKQWFISSKWLQS